MGNFTDTKNYKLSKEVKSNLKSLGYSDISNVDSAVTLVKTKFNYIIKYSQDETGFLGLVINTKDLTQFNVGNILGNPFKNVEESLNKSLELVTKLQLLKREKS